MKDAEVKGQVSQVFRQIIIIIITRQQIRAAGSDGSGTEKKGKKYDNGTPKRILARNGGADAGLKRDRRMGRGWGVGWADIGVLTEREHEAERVPDPVHRVRDQALPEKRHQERRGLYRDQRVERHVHLPGVGQDVARNRAELVEALDPPFGRNKAESTPISTKHRAAG